MNDALYDDEYEGRPEVLDDILESTSWLRHWDFLPDYEISLLAFGAQNGTQVLGPAWHYYRFICEAMPGD